MQSIPGLYELDPVSLSSLDPTTTPTGEITATVASLWPYSSSALKLTALIVELDYRKREKRGELKISFGGYAAENLKGLSIGNVIKISLEGAAWEPLSNAEEKDVPWQLRWEKRLRVKVFEDTSSTVPSIDIDRTFDVARRSGIFDRIAAAEAIINESQLENDEGGVIEVETPQRPSQLSASWSTSFQDASRGASPNPINIFAQGRRRLFSLDSDDEDTDEDVDKPRKRPRLFEPHQSFRYIGDPSGNAEEESAEEETHTLGRTEVHFFDENSFRDSSRESLKGTAESATKLFVRPDEPGDISLESQSSRTALGEKPKGAKMYIRPDEAENGNELDQPTQADGYQSEGKHGVKRRISETDAATADEIFKIIFGQEPNLAIQQPESHLSDSMLDEDQIFGQTLEEFTGLGTSSAHMSVPREGKTLDQTSEPPHIEKSTASPPPIEKSTTPPHFSFQMTTTPPFPESLHPVELGSQPMSSFTLDASPVSGQPTSDMASRTSQTQHVPRLDTIFSDRFDPITPVLRPTASPALPLPSPFPSSALEKGTTSFFPSKLSQSFTGLVAEDIEAEAEEEASTLAAMAASAAAAIQQMESDAQIKEAREIGEEEVPVSVETESKRELVEETINFRKETITVVEHASSLVDPESPRNDTTISQEEIRTKIEESIDEAASFTLLKPQSQEIIEILSSSDEEDEAGQGDVGTGRDEGRYDDDEYESEYEDVEEEESLDRRETGMISQESYEEKLALRNHREESDAEEGQEYADEGEEGEVEYSEEEGYPEDDEDDYGEEDDGDGSDADEMESKNRDATPSPGIEERESPVESDDDEPPQEKETISEPALLPSPTYEREESAGRRTPASRRSGVEHTRNVTSSIEKIEKSSIVHIANASSRGMTAQDKFELPFSPGPYTTKSTSPPPLQPQTPTFKKPTNKRTPTLEDDGFEITESPPGHSGSEYENGLRALVTASGRKRTLPWLTPQLVNRDPYEGIKIPNSVPDKLRTPTTSTKAAIKELLENARKIRPPGSTQKILKPKLDINPEAIRKFREYNVRSGVPAGVITSLSEFVPIQQLHKLEWKKAIDLLVVNLRDAEVVQNKNPPKFFQLKLWVVDPSCGNGKGFPVILTRPYQEALPRSARPGDVVLLRNVEIKSSNNQRCGFSTMISAWKVWRPSRAPDGEQEMLAIPHNGPNAEFGFEELAYVNSLWEWWKGIDVDVRVSLISKKDRKSD